MASIESNWVSIRVSFAGPNSHQDYTYVARRGHGLALGDLVIVPTYHGWSIGTVVGVDNTVVIPAPILSSGRIDEIMWKQVYCKLENMPNIQDLRVKLTSDGTVFERREP